VNTTAVITDATAVVVDSTVTTTDTTAVTQELLSNFLITKNQTKSMAVSFYTIILKLCSGEKELFWYKILPALVTCPMSANHFHRSQYSMGQPHIS
jgi:hypothetical protein